MFAYPSFGKITNAIEFTSEHISTIIIYFEHETITLYTFGDCCSHSEFEIPNDDLTPLIGRKILSIEENESYVDKKTYEYDNYNCEKVHPISIIFDDETKFDFVLRNTSNGYYDGWMEIREGEPTQYHYGTNKTF